eukprot:13157639-Ditylum_brightwellii.AAC.1
MESQRIEEFSRNMEDWQKRNNGTWCAFDGSGCEKVLSDRKYTDQRGNQNRKVFPNVSCANSRKMTYHLERQHIDSKDGYATRKSLNA